jgi:hypothetical protein
MRKEVLTKTQLEAWNSSFEIDNLKKENAELRKDKERLDWLLSEESNTNIEFGRYGRGEEYKPWAVDTLHNRAEIDEAMGGAG